MNPGDKVIEVGDRVIADFDVLEVDRIGNAFCAHATVPVQGRFLPTHKLKPVESGPIELWGIYKDGNLQAAFPHEVIEPDLFGDTVRKLIAYVVAEPKGESK